MKLTSRQIELSKPKDKNYSGSLNALYKEHKDSPNFNFFDYFEVNTQLLDIYREHKETGEFSIFTSDSIQNEPVLQPYWEGLFVHIYSATQMGTHKSKPEAYQLLSTALGCDPTGITYIDDSTVNVAAANSVGLNAFEYTSNDQIRTLLQNLK